MEVRRQRLIRPVQLLVAAILLGAIAVTSARYGAPLTESMEFTEVEREVEGRLTAGWAVFETRVNKAFDDLYIRYYDRRAPAEPTLAPSPTLEASP